MNKNWATFFSILFLIIGLGLIIIFAFNKSFNDGSGILNPTLASQFGGFISGIVGPIFSIVGFLILYITITTQQDSFKIQQFESKFFELIRYHRENVNQITYTLSNSKEAKEITGRKVFVELKTQLARLYALIYPIVETDDGIDKIRMKEITLNITYLIFFFGVSLNIEVTIKNILKKQGLSDDLINRLYKAIRELKTEYDKNKVKYGGHQSKLGFYFRHMYQTVQFIENQKFLSVNEQKEYMKIYRAQLTTYEQAILFFDSMSVLGEKWKTNGWITKYNLIKNIPEKFLGEFEPKEYYPEIKYEYEIE